MAMACRNTNGRPAGTGAPTGTRPLPPGAQAPGDRHRGRLSAAGPQPSRPGANDSRAIRRTAAAALRR
ncbi:hypothetical protein GCM10027570_02450 [Streptomonospora sediminis]